MRTLLRVTIPVEAGNAGIKDGSLPKTIQALVERLKPEAAYFGPDNGQRNAFFVFDLQDAAQIPTLVEPLFLGLNAEISLSPVMNFDDLRRGLAEVAKQR
jgi:hypothetical protein